MPTQRILIVEDDDAIREVLEEVLQLEGYDVGTAGNGEEGIHYLHQNPKPHLILLDLMMPIKDGFEFRAEQIANPAWSEIPVIVLSANANLEARMRQLGTDLPFLKKPVDLEVILDCVKNTISA